MNLSTDTSSTGTPLHTEVDAAARAALPLLPLAAPADVEPAAAEEVPGAHVGVVASFSGAENGQVAVLIDAEQARALTAGTDGDVAEAIRPSLEAAAQSLGPCTLGLVETSSAQALLDAAAAAGTDTALAALRGTGQPPLYVLLSRTARVAVPSQRGTAPPVAPPAAGRGMDVLRGVQLEVTVEIGRTRMTVQELLALTAGAVIELDRPVGSPADVLVNGQLFARGEVVVVDEDFAIRITEVIDPENGLA